jgi:putative ABC transport system permease protein
MRFWTVAVKNLLRRKTRAALTCIGMGVATCAFIMMTGATHGIEDSVTSIFQSRGTDIIVCASRSPQRLTGRLSVALGDRFRAIPGIHSVEPVLMDIISFEQGNVIAVMVMGWSGRSQMFDDLRFVAGRCLRPGDGRAALLGKLLAQNLDKRVGDRVDIEDGQFNVIGIYESANMLENGMAVVDLAELQELMGRRGETTLFRVCVDGPLKNDKETIARLCDRMQDLRDDQGRRLPISAMPTKEHFETNLELRVARAMTWTMSVTALLVAVIGVLNTMMVSVFERTREIGTLLAIGWGRSRIASLIFLEALILCCLGAALGVLMSAGLTVFLSTFEVTQAFLPRLVAPSIMIEGVLLTMAMGLGGAVVPALRAARMLPTEASRYE